MAGAAARPAATVVRNVRRVERISLNPFVKRARANPGSAETRSFYSTRHETGLRHSCAACNNYRVIHLSSEYAPGRNPFSRDEADEEDTPWHGHHVDGGRRPHRWRERAIVVAQAGGSGAPAGQGELADRRRRSATLVVATPRNVDQPRQRQGHEADLEASARQPGPPAPQPLPPDDRQRR